MECINFPLPRTPSIWDKWLNNQIKKLSPGSSFRETLIRKRADLYQKYGTYIFRKDRFQ